MKKLIFISLLYFIAVTNLKAQKGIDFLHTYYAGRKIQMNVDSGAKNVFYANVFPNQPHTFFNFLREVNQVNIQIYFRKTDSVQNYRYTILEDNKPIVVNEIVDEKRLKDSRARTEEMLRSLTFGTFPIRNKIIKIIVYNIQKPQDVYTTIFYGKSIPRAKIAAIGRSFKSEKGVDYKYIVDPKGRTELILYENDQELTIVKHRSDIDYIYDVSIENKETGKIVYNSTAWQYGNQLDSAGDFFPYVIIDKSVFKKSGDYEIIIKPMMKWAGCLICNITTKQIEKYIARYTLSIKVEKESYTKREVLIYTLIVATALGLTFLISLYFIKKNNKKRLAENEQQKSIAKLQLNSIRSQLNPHFLFNALSGIQNLMNKNEVDNANKYLSKFARLTRNVLDDKELISLLQEKVLLDDYLQMEQLRFGFQYELDRAPELDLDNIEIPSMLLQPFVENAVKHGISQKAAEGKIIITFSKQAKDLILTVIDNGNGFDTENKKNGLGLQLSHSRVDLLNSIYKENRFILVIQSTNDGTKVSLTLTDWL